MENIEDVRARAETFSELHKAGEPVILFNSWDVLTAKLTAKSFPAVATSSGAIASAQGYRDGEKTPLDLVISLARRIASSVPCPVTVDLEAGYSDDPSTVADTVEALIDAGVVGINLEDSLSGGERVLVDPQVHGRKIEAIRTRADKLMVPFFINARTDPFLMKVDDREASLTEAIARAKLYAAYGASGIFVPGLSELSAIEKLTTMIDLPINIMAEPSAPPIKTLAGAGVARVSFGGWPITAFAEGFSQMASSLAHAEHYDALSLKGAQ